MSSTVLFLFLSCFSFVLLFFLCFFLQKVPHPLWTKKSPLTYPVSRTCRWLSSTMALVQCWEFSRCARPETKPYTNASPPTVLERRALPPDSLFYVVGPSQQPDKQRKSHHQPSLLHTHTHIHTLLMHPFLPTNPGKLEFICLMSFLLFFKFSFIFTVTLHSQAHFQTSVTLTLCILTW